jgi:putative two-component system response regulator
MLVDDNRTNLMAGKVSLSDDYTVLTVSSARKMFDLLERQRPEVILLDALMPEMSGFEALKILRERPETKEIPVIFVTALSDPGKELEGIELGADDYVMKPFSPPLLRQRISLHVELARLRRMCGTPRGAIPPAVPDGARAGAQAPPDGASAASPGPQPDAAPGAALAVGPEAAPDQRPDDALPGLLKTQRAVISALAGRASWVTPDAEAAAAASAASGNACVFLVFDEAHRSRNWPEETERWDLRLIGPASLLHDIGKLYVPEGIILKPGRLTPEELEQARRHVELGTAFIRRVADSKGPGLYLRYAGILAGYHHERWDGRGYPFGLRGRDIPLLGRIMAVTDVYDALTSFRPYRVALDHGAAVRILREGAGTAFDPEVVEVFEKAMG